MFFHPLLNTELTFYCDAEPALDQIKGYVIHLDKFDRYQIVLLPEEYMKSPELERAIMTFNTAKEDDTCNKELIAELEELCKNLNCFPLGCNINTLGFIAISKNHFEEGVVTWRAPNVLEQIVESLQKEIL